VYQSETFWEEGMSEEVAKMNIYQRLNEVRKAVAYLRKEKEVTGGGTYKVVTHDQVTAAVRDHMVTHGVMVVPRLQKSAVSNTGTTTAKGIPIIRYEATYEIAFVNCDDPTDKVCVLMEAHALDQGDKAPGKAISYVTKCAMLKLFSIETGEEEEERPEVKAAKEEKKTHSPTDGAFDSLTPEDQMKAKKTVNAILDFWNEDKPFGAYEQMYESGLDSEQMLGVWELMKPHSKIRTALKKMHSEANKTS